MGFIYKITNKLNNKSYIGLTTKSIEERWQEHLNNISRLKGKRPLYTAMSKYGVETFTIEQIEEVDNDFLGEREIYWINYYNTYNKGYNATLGGDGKWTRIIEQYDLQGKHIATYNNAYEAVQATGISESVIRGVCRGQYKTARKYIFKYADNDTPIAQLIELAKDNKCYKIQVCQYSLSGQLLAIWRSIAEAQNETKIYNIGKALNDTRPHSSFVWRTTDKEFLDNLDLTKIIVQLDNETNQILGYFDSFQKAARAVGKNNGSHISECCNNVKFRHSAHGYKWRFLKDVL